MRPRILISRSESSAAENYVAAMYDVGCISDSIYAPSFSEAYDALILAGGGDVAPSLYGEKNSGSTEIDRKRDLAELRLCDEFVKRGKPILGICRGHQLLNVYFGGTLVQHIEGHSSKNKNLLHPTEAVSNGIICRLFGDAPVVNSIHHQAVGRLGDQLRATQLCRSDRTVEAFEHSSLPVVGVQWHPERMCHSQREDGAVDALPLFEYFTSLIR